MSKAIWVVLSLIFCCSILQSVDSQCITVEGKKGTCINLMKCPKLLQLLVNSTHPYPLAVKKKLKYSQCGIEGKYPKVCCLEATNSTKSTKIPKKSPPTPPDVTRHRNLGLLPENCGPVNDERIFGGNKTDLLEFPWMALISYKTNNIISFNCGGTIINERYILTAAHCITALSPRRTLYNVRVGEHDILTEEDCVGQGRRKYCVSYQDVNIEEAVAHPGYTPMRLKDDIGLIRLKEPLNFLKKINTGPICLPTSPKVAKVTLENTTMEVAGWGFTETGYTSSDLLKANLRVVLTSDCDKIYNRSIPSGIGYTQICAGGGGNVDSCGGDSGGPLKTTTRVGPTIRYVQYGIISFGSSNCGSRGWPGVHTRTAYYMDWILDNMKP